MTLASLAEPHLSELASALLREAAARDELGSLVREASATAVETRIRDLLRQAFEGERTNAEAALRELAWSCAGRDVPISVLHQLARVLEGQLAVRLIASNTGPSEELIATLGELRELVSWALEVGSVELVQALALGRDRAAQALHKSDIRSARLAQSGMVGVVVEDAGGGLVEANEAFARLLGYGRDELVSGAVTLAALTPPEWSAADEVARRQVRASGASLPYEKEFLRKDGGRVPVLLGVARLDDRSSIAFALDNSARRQLEQARRDALELEAENRRIQEMNRGKNEFLANLSHELRTPLNAIIGFGDLLHEGEAGALQEQQSEFVETILKSGRGLLRLINNVLDLVRVEAGKLDFRPEPINLAMTFADAITLLDGAAAAKRIRISAEVDAAMPGEVFLDATRLKQVLYCYLSNAIKFTPEGGSVWLRALPEGTAELRIDVEDTGVGIAPEHLHGLYNDLQPLEAGSAQEHGGAGLGLVLTRRLVEAQGGHVEVRSTPGKGSVFSAVLPRVAKALLPVLRTRRVEVAGTSVLVIEDDHQDQVMLVETLEAAGYSAQVASLGSEALALCAERRFDAITLDLLLPDMSGIDLLARIRKTGANRDTPVLVVSVAANSAVGFAVSDVLPKPASAQALLASLRAAGVQPGKPGEVMVVDDDPASLLLMTIALKQLGYKANCFQDGEAGLRAAELAPPAAVVLDLMMPGIDGFQFLERFRSAPATRKTPVLVWTTKDLSAEELSRLNRAVQGVVPKGRAGVEALIEDLRRVTSGQSLTGSPPRATTS